MFIMVLWRGLIKMGKCLTKLLAGHVFCAARCPSRWVWPGSLLRGHGRNYRLFLNFHFTHMQFLPMGKVLAWSGGLGITLQGSTSQNMAPRPTASASPTVLLKMQNLRPLPLLDLLNQEL